MPEYVKEKAASIGHFFVENARTARRMLKKMDPSLVIDTLRFELVNNQIAPDLEVLAGWLQAGHDVGVMSEAGCPGIADPGSELVAKAHRLGAQVVPLVGPSSLLLALMASGFNGQGFRFLGYLPIKDPSRAQSIKDMELVSSQRKETQLFIETPYRNDQLMKDLVRHCRKETRLCIAADITGPGEWIRTQTIGQWAAQLPQLHKRPVVFLLMA